MRLSDCSDAAAVAWRRPRASRRLPPQPAPILWCAFGARCADLRRLAVECTFALLLVMVGLAYMRQTHCKEAAAEWKMFGGTAAAEVAATAEVWCWMVSCYRKGSMHAMPILWVFLLQLSMGMSNLRLFWLEQACSMPTRLLLLALTQNVCPPIITGKLVWPWLQACLCAQQRSPGALVSTPKLRPHACMHDRCGRPTPLQCMP